jgi:pyroglutamyl-peptidase
MPRPRVLLTGFGPFPGVPDNPSSWLAETLAQRGMPDVEAQLHARVLPTAWQAAELMPSLYEELQPHVMIHFGVSPRAKTFRIERFAHNRAAQRADAHGVMPPAPVIWAEGADRFASELSAPALAGHLRACGVAAAASRSAGSYVCNFLYYHSLAWAYRQPGSRLILFVHVPPLDVLGQKALLRGGCETLRFVLASTDTQQKLAPVSGPTIARSETVLSAEDA